MEVKITIARYISDEPQPGIVECQLLDAHGRIWTFIAKTAIPWCAVNLDGNVFYPQPGTISCIVIGKTCDACGREVIHIDTSKPWDIETTDGTCQFDVFPESIVEDQK